MRRPEVTVVGAGPAGLMAAEVLAAGGASVTVLERMAAPARKFLLAGRGGLNLTHSEPLDSFLAHYGEARDLLEPAIRAFPPAALIDWCHGLGIETFIGSSGRVFPRTMKASPLLRAWLRRLDGLGVTFKLRAAWQGFGDGPSILAMGGASWPRLGSDGGFAPILEREGIRIVPFRPANSRFLVPWLEHFARRFAGTPLKNVRLTHGARSVRGEAMISANGIEGGAVYALSRHLRDEPRLPFFIDLKPDLSASEVAARLARRRPKDTLANHLRKALGLSPVAIALLRETKATDVKAVPLAVGPPEGLARAISSAGGVARDEVDANFMLRRRPLCYAVGEMLDWEAPTGGYLLQACFSAAVAAARDCLRRVG